MVVVYNVPGLNLAGVPEAPIETDKATAERLIRTGAFAAKPAGGADVPPVPYEANAQLDFYDSPVAHGDHYKTFKGGPPPEKAAATTTPEPAPAAAAEPQE
jgi:hypothetical protein